MSSVTYVVLAGGEGVRMKSDIPKPLRKIGGESMLERVVGAAVKTDPRKIVVVYRDERVRDAALGLGCGVAFQEEPLGTADAFGKALPECGGTGQIIVTCADIPMVNAGLFGDLYKAHMDENNYLTLLVSYVDDPAGYGRIIEEGGRVVKIVEEKEADERERRINLINSGVSCINRENLEEYLGKIKRSPVKGEYYLTDLVGIISGSGLNVGRVICDFDLIRGVNTAGELENIRESLEDE